jgi:hypothetical protein
LISEHAEMRASGLEVRAVSDFRQAVRAQISPLAVDRDRRDVPAAMPPDTCVSGGIAVASITLAVEDRGLSQIVEPVIAAVAVGVVDQMSRPAPMTKQPS